MIRARASRLPLAILLSVVAACDPTEPYRVLDEARVVETVRVTPDTITAALRDTFKLEATAIGRGNRSVSEARFEWTSGDLSVVRSLGDGRFAVVSAGTAQVFATTGGSRGSALLIVR